MKDKHFLAFPYDNIIIIIIFVYIPLSLSITIKIIWDKTNLEKMVPQSHLYSRVPQVFWWAFQSDCTAYFFEHLSHFHFFSPCFRLKCFLMPVRSPRARAGLWWTHAGSGHTYTLFLTSVVVLCLSFHGRLCPLRCSCRFWSLWNPLLQISHTNRFVAIRVVGDRTITSAVGST